MKGFALSGKAGAGKDTLAGMIFDLLAEQGHWGARLAFGDDVKAETLQRFGVTKEDPGGRARIIRVGEKRRLRDPLHWVKMIEPRLAQTLAYGVVPVITDLRFRTELRWARQSDLFTVRVDASLHDRCRRLNERGEHPQFAESVEPGECELDDETFDYRFLNDHGERVELMQHASRITALFLSSGLSDSA